VVVLLAHLALSSIVSGHSLKNLFSLTEPLGVPSAEAPLSAQ
jgi:hypothetical protein